MPLTIRRATPHDSRHLNRICLLTGNAGQSAESLHTHGELIGLVYAEPYVFPAMSAWTFGFVLVDEPEEEEKENQEERVLGYILGATDTREFERVAEEKWYPSLRERYPFSPSPSATEADNRFIHLLHHPEVSPQACIDFSPAHMHIDLLPEAQRQGWGRKLVDVAVEELKRRGLRAVWLGLDPRNEGARRFYERLGFEGIEGAPGNCMGMRF